VQLVGVAMAKNEADIVESFVRHNLRHLDRLVVIDHQSTDATGEILMRLRDEGLPLTVGLDRSLAFNQAERMTQALRQAITQFDADAVFALDADEMLVTSSRDALEAAVAAIPSEQIGMLPWDLYLANDANDARTAEDPPTVTASVERLSSAATSPFARLTERVVDARMTQCKVVVTREFASNPALHVSPGNHWVARVHADRAPELVQSIRFDTIRLAHLPFRSVEQVTQKIVLGHFAHRLAYGKRQDMAHVNWHWRHVYARIHERALTNDDLSTLALQAYLGGKPFEHADETAAVETRHDPLPPVELRYPELARVDPLRILMRWTDQLLTQAGH
jgi:hypothetical protein